MSTCQHIRIYSSNKKKSFLKVKNMPIYSTNISDFIVEFNRIKKNIKKLKKNYEEKYFSTYNIIIIYHLNKSTFK